jgi:hypothetical protein
LKKKPVVLPVLLERNSTVIAQKTQFSASKQASSGNSEPKNERRIAAIPKLRHHKATGQGYAVLNRRYLFFGLSCSKIRLTAKLGDLKGVGSFDLLSQK